MKFRVGGVPEHFNLPWTQALEANEFEKINIELGWTDYPGGTGAMCKDLREEKLDIAVLLTEGIVTDISKGNKSKIVQTYVKSPLVWGIHVPSSSNLKTIQDLKGKRIAISREGSGSHLMSYLLAKANNWDFQTLNYVIVGNIEGARKAFQEKNAEVFLWEKFMTKPLVDSGEFRRVGELPTPWPCFVVAVRDEVLKTNKEQVKAILEIVKQKAKEVKSDVNSYRTIAARYGIKEEDAKEWLAAVEWDGGAATAEMLSRVIDELSGLKLITEKPDVSKISLLL